MKWIDAPCPACGRPRREHSLEETNECDRALWGPGSRLRPGADSLRPLEYCQSCRVHAPTRHVVFNQNIGLLFVRFPSSVQGWLCKQCIHRFFWEMTLISLVAGWWGVISFFTNIGFIFGNIGTYVQCLRMPSAPRVADQR